PRQLDDRAHDLQVGAARPHAVHERAIDLDPVDREARQRGERRVPGAEVVDVQLDLELPQLMQHVSRRLDALHEHVLPDLQYQAAGRETRVLQRRAHVVRETRVRELLAGEVYAD